MVGHAFFGAARRPDSGTLRAPRRSPRLALALVAHPTPARTDGSVGRRWAAQGRYGALARSASCPAPIRQDGREFQPSVTLTCLGRFWRTTSRWRTGARQLGCGPGRRDAVSAVPSNPLRPRSHDEPLDPAVEGNADQDRTNDDQNQKDREELHHARARRGVADDDMYALAGVDLATAPAWSGATASYEVAA
jgi:hypothetical protein